LLAPGGSAYPGVLGAGEYEILLRTPFLPVLGVLGPSPPALPLPLPPPIPYPYPPIRGLALALPTALAALDKAELSGLPSPSIALGDSTNPRRSVLSRSNDAGRAEDEATSESRLSLLGVRPGSGDMGGRSIDWGRAGAVRACECECEWESNAERGSGFGDDMTTKRRLSRRLLLEIRGMSWADR
jgi:hypothetical protein